MEITTRRHAKYPRQLSDYAKAYGRSVESISAWIRRGKVSGWLPPLDSPAALRDWYERHVGAVPNDLAALWSRGKGANGGAGNGEQAQGERVGAAAAPVMGAAPMLDLESAVVEMRGILAQDIAELKRAGHGDGRRGVLLRHVQQTSDSLCRLENTLAGFRREKRDALPWAVFQEGVDKVLDRLVDIRKGMPGRVIAAVEAAYGHRVARVVRLIRGPLSEAITTACDQDVLALVSCPELRPIYEQYRRRARELAAAAADHA